MPSFPSFRSDPHHPYNRGVAYAMAADNYGWHHADADADCPFTGDDAKLWHRGVADEAIRQYEAQKAAVNYEYRTIGD